MSTSAPLHSQDACTHRECAHPERERVFTTATIITFVRTAITLGLAFAAAREESLPLLLWALATYWVGDSIDGIVARLMDQETRTGAALDIMCDRISAAAFYIGFAWYDPTMAVPVAIYLSEFMVIDLYLSLAFLQWPLVSPNYFYLVDKRLYWWNWSRPGKTVNSGLFAVYMVIVREPYSAALVAAGLFALKAVSMGWMTKLGMPVPGGCLQPEPVAAPKLFGKRAGDSGR
jgi:CDP-diacylglycerol--glycerol-3-phosphate 3-phosphatidyltransferase